jgi:hypothetical protein
MLELKKYREIFTLYSRQFSYSSSPLNLAYEHRLRTCSGTCKWWKFDQLWVCADHANLHFCTKTECTHQQWEVDQSVCEWTQQSFPLDLQDDTYKIDPSDKEFRKKNPRPEANPHKIQKEIISSTTINHQRGRKRKVRTEASEVSEATVAKVAKPPTAKLLDTSFTEECEARTEINRMLLHTLRLQHTQCFGEAATALVTDWPRLLRTPSTAVGWTYIVELYTSFATARLVELMRHCLRTWKLVGTTTMFEEELKHKYTFKVHIWVVLLALGGVGVRISATTMLIKPMPDLQTFFKVDDITRVFGDVKPRVYTKGLKYFRDCFVEIYAGLSPTPTSTSDVHTVSESCQVKVEVV